MLYPYFQLPFQVIFRNKKIYFYAVIKENTQENNR